MSNRTYYTIVAVVLVALAGVLWMTGRFEWHDVALVASSLMVYHGLNKNDWKLAIIGVVCALWVMNHWWVHLWPFTQ